MLLLLIMDDTFHINRTTYCCNFYWSKRTRQNENAEPEITVNFTLEYVIQSI